MRAWARGEERDAVAGWGGRAQLLQLSGGGERPRRGEEERVGGGMEGTRVPGALTPEAVASNFYLLRKLEVLVPGDLRLDSGAEASNVHTPHYPLPHLLSFIIVFIHL